MITSRWLLLSVSVIAILLFSTVFVAIPITPSASAQQKVPGANWEMEAYDNLGHNFNPQTQITKDSVRFGLELKWIFPMPPAPVVKGFGELQEGSFAPVLVVDGIVYLGTHTKTVFALDAKSGKLLWTFEWYKNFPSVEQDQKSFPNIVAPRAHSHAINYWGGYVVIEGFYCRDVGLNALTGKVAWYVEGGCSNVPGNVWPEGEGIYKNPVSGRPAALYKAGNVLIVNAAADGEGSQGGRAFMAGYDFSKVVAAGKDGYRGPPLWRMFFVPPAGGDPEWALRNCAKGWFFDEQAFKRDGTPGVRCTSLPRELLLNDWGKMRFNSGMSTIWGQFVVDEETGIFYVGSGQPGASRNGTYRPGPNLYSNSIMAMNAKSGEIVWWYQGVPHDNFDYDCSWNPMLAKTIIKGTERKVIYKTCKDAKLFAVDAATGEPYWVYTFPDIKFPGPSEVYGHVPLTREGLTKPWANYPSTGPYWRYAAPFEADIAFAYNTVYACPYNWNSWGVSGPVETRAQGSGGKALPDPYIWPVNSSISAIDASTGKLKWSYFVDGYPCRGGIIASGGVVYWPVYDGSLYMLDADTGKLLSSKTLISTGLGVRPTIGADADGKIKVFQLLSASANFRGPYGANIPGGLMALGLPDKLPEPQVITKEVIKEVPVTKEVIKEVPVTKEVIKEVTKTVTVETISPVSYAAIGIGVVLVVIAGVLFSRRKKA